jgi:hypothetical protein
MILVQYEAPEVDTICRSAAERQITFVVILVSIKIAELECINTSSESRTPRSPSVLGVSKVRITN